MLFEKDDPNNSNNKIQYKNNYEYVNDRLTKISHNTTGNNCDVEYNFEYDALGRKKKVKVGNATLSENVYSMKSNAASNNRTPSSNIAS